MNWEEKSPGISIAKDGDFTITRILLNMRKTGRIDGGTGRMIHAPVYTYIAAAGNPYRRYANADLQVVLSKIAEERTLSLF